jgi:hypothetical protein
MKSRLVAGVAVLFLCVLVVSCRNTQKNTPASQEQTSKATPLPAVTPATVGEEKSPAPSAAIPADNTNADNTNADNTNKEAPSQTVDSQKVQVVPAPPPPPILLPVGTVLTVRLNETVDTKNSPAGSRFTGSIGHAVMQQGRTVIPVSSTASGVVDQSQQGGKIKGSSSLSLRLTSITVAGVSYPIRTDPFLEQGKGKGGRSTKMGAGGAAAGAVVGGLAGGGKGALIGTAVGAGAGVAGSAFTGNNDLVVPAESVLQFKLAQPLKLNQEGSRKP